MLGFPPEGEMEMVHRPQQSKLPIVPALPLYLFTSPVYSFPSVLPCFSIFLEPPFSPPFFLVYIFALSLARGISILSLFVFGW